MSRYRYALRQTCQGTVAELMAIREILIRGDTLRDIALNKSSPTPEDIRFMLLGMMLEARQISDLSAQLPQDALLIFRSSLFAQSEREILEVHEEPDPYIVDVDVPF